MPRKKKSFIKKVGCFFRKWMSAKIIPHMVPHMVLNGWRIFFIGFANIKSVTCLYWNEVLFG